MSVRSNIVAGTSGLSIIRRVSVDAAAMLSLKVPDRTKDVVNENTGELRTANMANLSSDRISDYEKRIESLVDSNKAQINQISVLKADQAILQKEIEVLHRMNFVLTKSVDDFRAGGGNNMNPKSDNGKWNTNVFLFSNFTHLFYQFEDFFWRI